jgi:hypothetical protein
MEDDDMPRKGFLLVLMQPPLALDEEFNAWYDLEHVPERKAVPGVETALRYSAIRGVPAYLAMYDLSSAAVLETEAYRRVAGDNSSPWTKRITSRTNVYRSIGDQIYPGDAPTPRAPFVHIVRVRGLDATRQDAASEAIRTAFERRSSTIQVRVFAYPADGKVDVIGFVAASAPGLQDLDTESLRSFSDAIDLINTYVPR